MSFGINAALAGRTNRPIYRAFNVVAQVLGSRLGVQVQVGGCDAFTDGSRIQLPALDDSSDAVNAAWGFLAHESAHILYSDFSLRYRRDEQFLEVLVNAVEDPRIEKLISQKWMGVGAMLDDSLKFVESKGELFPLNEELDPLSCILAYANLRGRSKFLCQQAAHESFETYQAILKNGLPAKLLQKMDALLDQAYRADSESEVRRLMKKLLKLFPKEAEQQPPQSGGSDDQNQDQGDEQGEGHGSSESGENSDSEKSDEESQDGSQDETSNSDSESSDEGDDADSGDSGAGDESDDQRDDEGGDKDSKDDGSQTSESEESGENSPGDSGADSDLLSQAVQAIQEGQMDPSLQDRLIGEVLAKLLSDEAQDNPSDAVTHGRGITILEPADGVSALDEAIETGAVIRDRMRALVEDRARVKRGVSRRGRQISSRRISRIATGNPNVFRTKSEGQGVDTACVLLGDISGSMGYDRRMPMLRASVFSMASASESIPNLEMAVSYFDSTVYPVIGFGESAFANAERFNMTDRGGTHYLPAMEWALGQLATRPERNHMIVVLGDGQTCGASAFSDLCRKCEDSDIKVFGLGIQTDEMDGLFTRPVANIEDLSQLEGALSRLILPELLGGAV